MHTTTGPSLDRIENLCKALADQTRLRAVALLSARGELCVCQVEQILGVTQSRASRHLKQLRDAGLLADRKEGLWVYYRINEAMPEVHRRVVLALRPGLPGDETFPAARACPRRAGEAGT